MFGRAAAADDGVPVGSTSASASSASSSSEYTWTLRGHPWIRRTVRAYFMGGRLVRPNGPPRRREADDRGGFLSLPAMTNDPLLPHETDPTYPPNRNRRRRREEHIDVLMDAREVRVRLHPIQWNGRPQAKSIGYEDRVRELHRGKDEDRLRSEAEDVLEVLASSMPSPHFEKLMGRLKRFARLEDGGYTGHASSRGPDGEAGGWYVEDDGGLSSGATPLPELLPSRAAANADYKKRGIPALGKFLKECSDSHSHLVAANMASFFYVNVGAGEKVVAADPDVVGPDGAAAERVDGKKHRRLNTTEKKYDKARDEFVKMMMGLQHEFASWEVSDESAVETTKEGAGIGGGIEHECDDDDYDVSSDLLVSEFLKAQKPYSAESRNEQREEVKETLAELHRVGLRNDEIGAKNKMKGRGRPQIGVHLKFTAIRMEKSGDLSPTSSESYEIKTEAESPSEDRLVFINNLPIDVSEEEIEEIYSRCGPLDSIQLFNLRPDLDPGPITNKQLRERRRDKKLRKNNSQSLQRPRTPVYGILRFQTDEGYRVATSQELCIFGCVIRRHPVLSIRPRDMDTLYVEKIPTDLYSIDLEHKLAQLLQPHHIHIALDDMNVPRLNGSEINVNGNHQEYSKPSSCQVKFPNFETASEAYRWISHGMIPKIGDVRSDENNKPFEVHWFRTPSNSMGYWTRDLGF
ncbi:hypothetical protein ACHAW5_009689 [Stephanodiscus triporus]|uniref:RRM domain-containing protein n=1 Tax=Stephanodiscus triporus TaxID=2934178 RepID=A0ABD3PMR2_9STRA